MFDIFSITALGHVPAGDCVHTLIIGVSNAVDIVNDFRKIFHLFRDICGYSYLLLRCLLDDLLAFGEHSALGSDGGFELGLLLLNDFLILLLPGLESLDLVIVRLDIDDAFTHSLGVTFSSGGWTADSYTGDVLREHVA